MQEDYTPAGFTEVTPFLTIAGLPELLDFVVAVFGAQVIHRVAFPDGKLRHAAVKIGQAHIQMSEARAPGSPMPGALHVYVPDVDQTHCKALEHGAQLLFEPADMDFGERSSGVKDPVGNHWYIATYTGKFKV